MAAKKRNQRKSRKARTRKLVASVCDTSDEVQILAVIERPLIRKNTLNLTVKRRMKIEEFRNLYDIDPVKYGLPGSIIMMNALLTHMASTETKQISMENLVQWLKTNRHIRRGFTSHIPEGLNGEGVFANDKTTARKRLRRPRTISGFEEFQTEKFYNSELEETNDDAPKIAETDIGAKKRTILQGVFSKFSKKIKQEHEDSPVEVENDQAYVTGSSSSEISDLQSNQGSENFGHPIRLQKAQQYQHQNTRPSQTTPIGVVSVDRFDYGCNLIQALRTHCAYDSSFNHMVSIVDTLDFLYRSENYRSRFFAAEISPEYFRLDNN